MVQTAFNGMIAILLAKFLINDLPHAAGLTGTDYERPPTTGQLRYIASLCQQLKMPIPYEEQVRTFGEAGRMIREFEAEREYRRKQKKASGNPVPVGTCFPDAWRYVMHNAEKQPVLVHGTAISIASGTKKRIQHAWVELPDGTVWEPYSGSIFPIEEYYGLVEAIPEDRYTVDEAASMLSAGKHGPWTAEERMEHIGR